MNRIGLKISCLLISVIIWFQVAATSTVEQNVDFPLKISGLGSEFTIAGSALPKTVAAKVRGSKLKLLSNKYFNRDLGEVRISFGDRLPGPEFSYEVDQADVFTDLEVVGIQPPVRLRLQMDRNISRMVPVNLVSTGELDVDLGFLQSVTVSPDSVLVSGPERFFQAGRVIQTQTFNLSAIKHSDKIEVLLNPLHEHLEFLPPTVMAEYLVGRLEDRTLANIPVVPLVDAGQSEVGVSPPVADVMVRGVADSVAVMTKDRFSVTVNVGSLSEGTYTLPGQVEYPPYLTLIGMDPPEFQVIIGQPASPETLDTLETLGLTPDSEEGFGD